MFANNVVFNILAKNILKPQLLNFARYASSGNAVGFIGLGNMGGHMATNLAKKGQPVIVYDLVKESIEQVKSEVGSSGEVSDGSSPSEICGNPDVKIVVTMLPSSPHVLEVYLGQDGLLSKVKPDTLFIDSTTGDPAVAQKVEAACREKGAHYLDAPVSGGVLAARDALITFMVGGEEKQVDRAKPILQLMGKNIFHCGPVGSGEAAKICNNMLLGISMIGTAETFNLGAKLGLDPQVLARIINTSSGRCWSSEMYNPVPGVLPGVPASRDYQGGFYCGLMTKDLGLAQDVSTSKQAPTPLGSLAHQIYRMLSMHGYAGLDFGVIYKYLSEAEKKP